MLLRNHLINNKFFLALNIMGLLLALCFISGCGFTLRSQQSFPPQLHTLYFQADKPYGQFEVALRKALKAANITLLDDANKAPLIFHVSETSFNHSSDTSSGPSSQARIYHLTMTTYFSIIDNHGNVLLAPQNVTSTRDLTLNSNEIFDTSTQIDVSKQNMRQELITKIFNILSSQKVFAALQKN